MNTDQMSSATLAIRVTRLRRVYATHFVARRNANVPDCQCEACAEVAVALQAIRQRIKEGKA